MTFNKEFLTFLLLYYIFPLWKCLSYILASGKYIIVKLPEVLAGSNTQVHQALCGKQGMWPQIKRREKRNENTINKTSSYVSHYPQTADMQFTSLFY